MDTNNETHEPAEDFQKRMQGMLKKANVQFVFGSPMPQQGPGATGPEKQKEQSGKSAETLRKIREFNLKPKQVRDYLDRFVIKQSEAKKVLSVAICDHYNHVRRCIEDPSFQDRDYAKHNVILIGPTGVGKTYLLRCVAKLIGVPFVKADATKFSETGYVGHDVEDLARDLVRAADGDAELAKYGIIYIDEIDKIAGAPLAHGRDVSGRGVQVNLLKLMEETDVNLLSQTDILGQIQAVMELQRGGQQQRTINTRHMLFIVSGAFDKLADLVKHRVESSQIGFVHAGLGKRADAEYLRQAQTRDFIEFGFEPEFVGRLPVRIVCEHLTADDLVDVLLKSEGSVLRQYQDDFAGYGIGFSIDDAAVAEVARLAETEKTGARGLMTVLEKVLRDFKFELPSTPLKSFRITRKTVVDPRHSLDDLLGKTAELQMEFLRGEVAEFARSFEKAGGFRLDFTPTAVEALVSLSIATGKPARAVCEEKFRDLQHGLTLVSKNTGLTAFPVTKKMVDDPDRQLSLLIAKSFRSKS